MNTIRLQRPGNSANSLESHRQSIDGNEFSITLDTNKPTQRYIHEILLNGLCYEEESTMEIASELREGDVFFDIGANCGWFSAMALAFGAKVWAFEPDPDNCVDLKKNAPGAIVIEGLLSDISGERDIFVNLDNDGGHALWECGLHPHNTATAEAGNPRRKVKSFTLDDFHELNPAIIKMDTEGAECNILLGAEKVLSNPSLRMVICERHLMGLHLLGHGPQEVEDIMRRHGFKWQEMANDGNVKNWIFKRK